MATLPPQGVRAIAIRFTGLDTAPHNMDIMQFFFKCSTWNKPKYITSVLGGSRLYPSTGYRRFSGSSPNYGVECLISDVQMVRKFSPS